jgi:iron complex outermembrane receptor protein
VFGQLTLDLSDSWELSLGSRVERIKKKGAQTYSTTSNAYKTQLNETLFLPKASLSYYPSDNSMIYASIAKGYTPGGFNYASAQNFNSFTYSAQTSINAEVGYKTSLLEDALDVSAVVFHISAKDKQISDLQPGFVQSIANAAQATSYGLEVSADYRISTALSFYAQLGLLHAEADQYSTNVFSNGSFVATSLAGYDLPMAPSYTYALGVKYDDGTGLFSDLTMTGSSDYYFDSANTLKQTGYNRIDAQLGYHFSNDLSLSMVGENLFDTQIYSRAVKTSAGIAVEDTAARYIGLKLRGHW